MGWGRGEERPPRCPLVHSGVMVSLLEVGLRVGRIFLWGHRSNAACPHSRASCTESSLGLCPLPQEEGWLILEQGSGAGGWEGRVGGALRLPFPAPLSEGRVLGSLPSEMLELERRGGVHCGAGNWATGDVPPWGCWGWIDKES